MTATLLESRAGKKELLSLSVSKVKTFKDCAAKYYYTYIDKSLPKKEWDFLAFGKFLHQALEDYHQLLMDGDTRKPSEIMTECFKNSLKVYKLSQVHKDEAFKILTGYLELLKKQKEDGTLPEFLRVEKSFVIDIDGRVLLNGFIDRVELDTDGILHISDYKSSKDKKFLKNDLFQLQTYAFAAMLEDPSLEEIRTSYIMLRHDFERITRLWTREEILATEGIYIEYADAIQAEKKFAPNPTFLCSFCDALSVCKDGRKFLQSIGKLKDEDEEIKFW